ncbi:hypothetical protein [Oxynema sp. CENA135]|nr:hypothetical protein [Oxynema sp. CENA135]
MNRFFSTCFTSGSIAGKGGRLKRQTAIVLYGRTHYSVNSIPF